MFVPPYGGLEFPYKDNLNWIIAKIKELMQSCTSLQEAWEKFQEEFKNELSETVTEILNSWIEDGTLASIILFNIVDVKSYGAKGDGFTDDSDAIQSCINENVGKIIYFPPENIFLAKNILVPENSVLNIEGEIRLYPQKQLQLLRITGNNIHIYGNGILNGNKEFQTKGVAIACIYIDETNIYDNILIDGLTIKNSLYWGANLKCTNSTIRNCTFIANDNMSFFAKSDNCIIENCIAKECGNDYALGFYYGCTNCILSKCIAYNNISPSLAPLAVVVDNVGQLLKCENILITDCISYDNTSPGIHVYGINNNSYIENITINNCIVYNNGNSDKPYNANLAVRFAENVKVTNCRIYDSAYGIYTHANCTIENCDIDSTTTPFTLDGITIVRNCHVSGKNNATLVSGENEFYNNCFNASVSGTIDGINHLHRFMGNKGIRSLIGKISDFKTPASGSYYKNNGPTDMQISVNNATNIIIFNTNIGAKSAVFNLAIGESFRIDYSDSTPIVVAAYSGNIL